MNRSEGHYARSTPPTSHRTLHHPSFMPLYMAAGFATPHALCNSQAVHPIIPSEFFYSDPTMSCGRRVPNIVSELRVFDCFQLNTPSPIMSSCLAPPVQPDPFRSGPHPTSDLGSLTFKPHPPAHPRRVVVQLTQQEDEAITNLLKLHHQEPINPNPFLCHPEPMDSSSVEDVDKHAQHLMEARLQQGICWSDAELEAANTLLSRFSLMEISDNKSAATGPDPHPNQRQGSDTLPAGCIQNDGDVGFVERGNADDVCEEYLVSSGSEAKSRSSVSGGLPEVKEQML